jgi:ABC-type multidrug transport system ATPase subunit
VTASAENAEHHGTSPRPPPSVSVRQSLVAVIGPKMSGSRDPHSEIVFAFSGADDDVISRQQGRSGDSHGDIFEIPNEAVPKEPSRGRNHNVSSKIMEKLLGIHSTPCEVAFHKLKMQVDMPGQGWCSAKTTKTVLHEVSGIFASGKFTAIMGSSGAGKTSLLNAIGGEAAGGILSGRITVNGQGIATDTMRRLRAFVFQDDVMMGTMTVREIISMSARLRLPETISMQEKMDRVEQVIQVLRLEGCCDTVMGYSEASNISGGERKRVAIAMELVTNPSVIFLDEPTSGLDTFTAYTVCRTLKDLAQAGRTVVATIHQPSSEVS